MHSIHVNVYRRCRPHHPFWRYSKIEVSKQNKSTTAKGTSSSSLFLFNGCIKQVFFALRPQSHLELLMSQKWVLLDCSRKKGMCHRRAAISVCYEGGALRSVRVSYLEETTLSPQLLWVMSGKRQGNAFGFLGKSRLVNLLPTFTETHFVLHRIHMVLTKKSIDL